MIYKAYQLKWYVRQEVLEFLASRGILDETLELISENLETQIYEDESEEVLARWGFSLKNLEASRSVK